MENKLEVIDYAEKAGLENLRFRLQVTEALLKDATSTLTFLIAGIGGSLAYAASGFDKANLSALAVGAAVLSLWLMVISALLVIRCMGSQELQTPTNEPLNLFKPEYAILEIREVELRNIHERIQRTRKRNEKMATSLDAVRLLAIASPVVFGLSALVWGYF
jgi:hypothetical protein